MKSALERGEISDDDGIPPSWSSARLSDLPYKPSFLRDEDFIHYEREDKSESDWETFVGEQEFARWEEENLHKTEWPKFSAAFRKWANDEKSRQEIVLV